MPGPLEGLKKATGIGPDPTVPSRTGVSGALNKLAGMLTGVAMYPEQETGPLDLLLAGTPILSGLGRGFKYWHDIPDLERLAGGSGPFRTYHGTPNVNLANILKEGIRLPESGEAASRAMATRYGIPWPAWKRDVPWSGYGTETSRLSTAPYPVAARWAQHFPLGEVDSQLNAEAQMLAEALRRKVPYDQLYEETLKQAEKRGVRNIYHAPSAAGLPNRSPSTPGGAVLGVDTDVRALNPGSATKDAEYILNSIEKGRISPLDALKAWNLSYKDMKVAPQNIKGLEVVETFPRRK